ncbi:MAG: hypothetical protein AAGF90_02070 [Pseudomonadota bacterium]
METTAEYDGRWAGSAKADRPGCFNFAVSGDIVNGRADFVINKGDGGGRYAGVLGRIWGSVEPGGEMTAKLGKTGFVNGFVYFSFEGDEARGRMVNEYCEADIVMKRNRGA